MNRLKELRTLNNMTQQEVADYINMTRSSYTNIENGKRACTLETAAMFAALYNVSIDCVYGREPLSTEKKPVVDSKELDERLVRALVNLRPDETQRVLDFVAGIQANRREEI